MELQTKGKNTVMQPETKAENVEQGNENQKRGGLHPQPTQNSHKKAQKPSLNHLAPGNEFVHVALVVGEQHKALEVLRAGAAACAKKHKMYGESVSHTHRFPHQDKRGVRPAPARPARKATDDMVCKIHMSHQ